MQTDAKSKATDMPPETVDAVGAGDKKRVGLVPNNSGDKAAGHPPVGPAADGSQQQIFRHKILEEVYAMSRFLTGGTKGEVVSPHAASVLGSLDRGDMPTLEDLLTAHGELKALVTPAAPNSLVANYRHAGGSGSGMLRFLGPNRVARRLACANLFFLLLFFGVSLSPEINLSTLDLSIYEQSGMPLLIKLIFLVAAAGLGASFGALFDVWDKIKTHSFDPNGESVHWMKVGLGIVAGLTLTEIFQARALTNGGQGSSSDALLALVGGFSAGLLHVALSRTVNAVKSIFEPNAKP